MPPPSHRGRWDPVRWNARAALATRRQDQILAAAVCHHCLRLAGHGDRAALFRRTDAFHGASVLLHGQPRSLDCDVQPYIARRATRTRTVGSPISWRGGLTRRLGFRSPSGITSASRKRSCGPIGPKTSCNTCRGRSIFRRTSTFRGQSASRSSRRRCSTILLCCKSTQNISLGCCHCRSSSASAYWAEIGRSGPPPGPISSGSGVQLSRKPRPISMWPVIGISPQPKRPDLIQRPRLDGRHQARPQQEWRLLAARYGAPAGEPGRRRKTVAQHRLAGRHTGPHRVWPRPGAGR